MEKEKIETNLFKDLTKKRNLIIIGIWLLAIILIEFFLIIFFEFSSVTGLFLLVIIGPIVLGVLLRKFNGITIGSFILIFILFLWILVRILTTPRSGETYPEFYGLVTMLIIPLLILAGIGGLLSYILKIKSRK